ncbi:MAG: 4Fe-4S binding protein [Chloroflexi bacterium]|nr:4Fe-4S binding protein [Chloroflexota bacterium]MBU1749265.1 4Fe-4S binding protein [Chloroflexota bacterium]
MSHPFPGSGREKRRWLAWTAGAIVKRPTDGLVLVALRESACLGCGDCVDACPYGAIQVDPVTGLASKCDFCADHIAAGRPPICVSACPMRVLGWGLLADLQARYGMLADVPPLPGDAIRRPVLVITPHDTD